MADKRIYDCLANSRILLRAKLEQIDIDMNALVRKNVLIKLKAHYENMVQDNVNIVTFDFKYNDEILNVNYDLEYGSEKYSITLYKSDTNTTLNVYNGTTDLIYSSEYISAYKVAVEPYDKRIDKIMKSTCFLFNDDMVLFFTYPF